MHNTRFHKAYKVNFTNAFCQITAVFRIAKGAYTDNHPVILTVRKDGSDVDAEVAEEIKDFSKRYDNVSLLHFL